MEKFRRAIDTLLDPQVRSWFARNTIMYTGFRTVAASSSLVHRATGAAHVNR